MSLRKEQVKKSRRKHRRFLYSPYYDLVKFLGGGIAALCMRPKVHRITENVPKRMKGGVVIAANHTSFSDAVILFVVFWYRRLAFLATKDLFNNKFNKIFFRNLNCIEVDKEKFSTKTLRAICDRLNGNHPVVIFPEGKINGEGETLLDFKEGTVYVAMKCNKPILPVYIAVRDSLKKRHNVVIGEPVYVNELYTDAPRADRIKLISEYLRDYELRLKNYYDEEVEKSSGSKKQNIAPDIQYSGRT